MLLHWLIAEVPTNCITRILKQGLAHFILLPERCSWSRNMSSRTAQNTLRLSRTSSQLKPKAPFCLFFWDRILACSPGCPLTYLKNTILLQRPLKCQDLGAKPLFLFLYTVTSWWTTIFYLNNNLSSENPVCGLSQRITFSNARFPGPSSPPLHTVQSH